MFEFTLRSRMCRCIKLLEGCDNNILSGSELQDLWKSPKNRKALKALEAQKCIHIEYAYYGPIFITLGESGPLYLLTRSEIWRNRIIGYILGIASAIIADLVVFFMTGSL